jgi:hypothetical protein
MKIYGRGKSAQSSSHTDSWMNRSNGDSHHPKISYRLGKTIPIFLIAFFFPKVKTALKRKRLKDAEDIKKNIMAELNAVPLEAFTDHFQTLFK